MPIAPSPTAPRRSLGDLLLGDPRRGHPVAAFGRAAGAVERGLWRDHRGRGALTPWCARAAPWRGPRSRRAPCGRPPRVARADRRRHLDRARRHLAGPRGAGHRRRAGRRATWRRPGSGCRTCAGATRSPWTRTADRAGRGRVGRREHLRRGGRRPGVGRARGRARARGFPGGQHAGRDGRAQVGQVPQVSAGPRPGSTTWRAGRAPGSPRRSRRSRARDPRGAVRAWRAGRGPPPEPQRGPGRGRVRRRARRAARRHARPTRACRAPAGPERRRAGPSPSRTSNGPYGSRAGSGWLTLAAAVATRAAVRKGRTWVAGC